MTPELQDYFDRFNVSAAAREAVTAPSVMFINGEFTAGTSADSIPVLEPSTGAQLTALAQGTNADVDAAVAAARKAFDEGPWPRMVPAERQRILWKLADLIERDADILAEIETIDNGKAIGPCKDFDVLGSVELLRYMGGWATKIEGATRQISAGTDFFSYTVKEPIGVVGAVTPWNWPMNMAMWKLAAPLAVGCTMVLKTAELTPLSMAYVAKLMQEAGLPEGVFNIVTGHGHEVGAYLTAHPGVDKVSFTGSTRVGREVGKAAMSHFAPVTLELGGKSPMVAFEDADLEGIAEATRWSIFFNSGQNCSAGSRLYLHEDVFEQGLEVIKSQITQMKLCPGLDPDCDIGPVISAGAKANIERYLDLGRDTARTVFGGEKQTGDGFFVEPTLFAVEDNSSPLVQEEIFGPVLVALPFKDEAEAIALANDNPYGLGASVWSRDGARAQRVMRQLQAGSVWINCHDVVDVIMPFGGVKNSGFGKDLGREQIDHYLHTKAVTMAL
ncbi:aldehyde dehydrogenase family protein [Ruegeria sp.]|uniref:aldehyde dehydrogenase family protein n=1 Tax=Ruegeria sp. TaxID=1879320 RepID=UPI00232295C6|nr:aldehyde dehydrogenase family protein [Ruegeria sp.]MDA7966501.1 aldehyde dehydrogenase family protein [Ruegeria sp.]